MSKELCFRIDGKNLYLEQTLVEYEKIPNLFLCSSGKQYFLVLCVDIEKFIYIIVFVEDVDVSKLLHGEIPIRDVFLLQKEYWEVITGEEVILDTVEKHNIVELEHSVLPKENTCFEALTGEVRAFIRKFDYELTQKGKEVTND